MVRIGPVPTPRRRGRSRLFVALVVIALGVAAVAIVTARSGDRRDGDDSPSPDAVTDLRVLAQPTPLIRIAPASDDARRVIGADGAEAALVQVDAVGPPAGGGISLFPCGQLPPDVPTLALSPDERWSHHVIVPIGTDDGICVDAPDDTQVELQVTALLGRPGFDAPDAPIRVLDTRAAGGPLTPGDREVLDLDARPDLSADPFGMVALTVATTAGDGDGAVTVGACDATGGSSVVVRAGVPTARPLVVPIDADGALCVSSTVTADVVIDVTGAFGPSFGRPFASPAPVVDTRAGAETFDDRFAAIGVRPEASTLRVPVGERIGSHDGLVGLVVDVTAADPLDDGELSVYAAGPDPAPLTALRYDAGTSASITTVVPTGPDGDLCVGTTGRTDLVVRVVGLVALDRPADSAASGEVGCPHQELLADHRIVAMYGTPRTPRLGVLGEQDAEAAARRLDELAEPWRAGDRTVLPAFEMIATLATRDAGRDGLHRLRSSPDDVQEYLDVARRHGFQLILDIQPGWSDFLTEAQYYEEFLRQPDVGLALDPEWKTTRPDPPLGGRVGQTTADEVNAVASWLAQLVDEEDLPEKLLVVHQFQERMVLDRDRIVEPPGVALTIHMDGFGSRAVKQDTWSNLKVEPPWSNGLKLFFDEDIDMYAPAEILAGAFDPIPDLITYQ